MKHTRSMALTALLAAMIAVTTAYLFHIPVGVNEGYIHFGDALIYLAACLLPRSWAIAAAVLGGGLADLLTAPAWLPATVIIKALVCLPFANKGKFCRRRNLLALLPASLVTLGGYALAEGLLFGDWRAAVISISVGLIQAAGSGALFVLLGMALDRLKFKQHLHND